MIFLLFKVKVCYFLYVVIMKWAVHKLQGERKMREEYLIFCLTNLFITQEHKE